MPRNMSRRQSAGERTKRAGAIASFYHVRMQNDDLSSAMRMGINRCFNIKADSPLFHRSPHHRSTVPSPASSLPLLTSSPSLSLSLHGAETLRFSKLRASAFARFGLSSLRCGHHFVEDSAEQSSPEDRFRRIRRRLAPESGTATVELNLR
ncbi:hypothetical protein CRG98_009098 [Punica granatum]|uniref:Uncharacterized protein n=1 Tax=Punica granatum TaxID=22663 RepID=A0A2I0KQJ8_PUNGR|nr:hypothetical protein CRG98_009098 [Punica granatum]